MWPFSRRPDDARGSTSRGPHAGEGSPSGRSAPSSRPAASGPRSGAPAPLDLPDDASIAQQLSALQNMGLHLRRGVDHEDLQLRHAGASPRPDNFQLLLLGAGDSLDRPVRELVVGTARPPRETWDAATLTACVRDTLATAEEALGSSGHVEDVGSDYDHASRTGTVRVTLGGASLEVPLEGADLSPVLDALLAQLVPPRMVPVPLLRIGDERAGYRRLIVPKQHAQQARAIAVRLSRAPSIDLGDLDRRSPTAPAVPDGDADSATSPSTSRAAGTAPSARDTVPADATAPGADTGSPDSSFPDSAASIPTGPDAGSSIRDTPSSATSVPDSPAAATAPTADHSRRISALVQAGLRLDPRLSVDDVAAAVEPARDPADWDPYLDAVVTHPVRGRIPAWSNIYRFPPEDTMADSSDDWIAVVGDVARAAGSWDRLSHAEVVYEPSGDLPAGIGLTLGGQRLRVEADVWGALLDLVAVARLCEALTPKGRSAVHLPNHAAWVTPHRAEALSKLIGEY